MFEKELKAFEDYDEVDDFIIDDDGESIEASDAFARQETEKRSYSKKEKWLKDNMFSYHAGRYEGYHSRDTELQKAVELLEDYENLHGPVDVLEWGKRRRQFLENKGG